MAQPIGVGLGALSAQTLAGSSAEASDAVALTLDACVLAEEAGLDSVWASEHHFADDGYLPSPLTFLAAASSVTERVRLGTNVMIGGLYDRLRLAEDAVVVDHLSRGRLMLGLGLGYRDIEFLGYGHQRAERARRLETTVNFLRLAWSGQPVTGLGLLGERAVRVTPPPAQPAGPPILIGAFADVGVRRARRMGDGWIAPELAHPGGLRKRVRLLDLDARDEPFHIALTINAFVAPRDAWAIVRPGVERVGVQYRAWMAESGDIPSLVGTPHDAGADDSGRPPQFVAGTPQQCVSQLRSWWDALAVLPDCVIPHVTLRMTFPGVSRRDTFESIRLMAAEVVPALRAEQHGRSPEATLDEVNG